MATEQINQALEDAANKYSPDPSYSDDQWEFGDVIDGFKAGAEWQKEQLDIPTDEEIEKKAEQSAIEWWKSEPDPETDKFFTEEFNEVKEKWAKQDYCCGYEDGYTQALKDLGYE